MYFHINLIELSLKSPCLHAVLGLLSPSIPSFRVIRNVNFFIKSHCEMLKLSILCTRFEINCSSSTCKSSEIICSSSGGAQERWKTRWNSVYHQNWRKKLVLVPVILLCKIFIPSYTFDSLLCRTWPFSPLIVVL
jgi:hypothetical protein